MGETNWGLLNTDFTDQQDRAFSYADKVRQHAVQSQAGSKYAQGDYAGAAQVQAQAGNIPQAQMLQQYDQQTATNAQAYLAKSVKTFAAIAQHHASDPDGGAAAVSQYFDQIAPEVKSVTGVSDQKLMALKQSLVADPIGTLSHLYEQLPVEYKTSGDTLLQFRGNDLANTWTGGKQQVVGNKIVDIPFSANGPQGAQGAPAGVQSPGAGGALIPAVNAAATRQVESGGNPNAVSPAGAVGPMQTMPGTLQSPGFGVKPAADGSSQEQQRVGEDYLQAMQTRYQNPVFASIAYDMGPGRTDRWIADGADFHKLPLETQQYLGRIAVEQASQTRGQGQPPQQQPGAPQPQSPGGAPAGPRVIYDGGPQWRAPTPDELKQYPGATQVNGTTGAVKYPPTAMAPSQLSQDAIKQGAAYFIQNGGKFPGTMRDRPSVAAIQNYVATLKPPGMSETDWARVIQNNGLSLEGRKAAIGQASKGQIGTAINEGTVNNSINILRKVMPIAASRGSFTTLNNLQQYIGRATNDAGAVNFKNAVDSITAEYARVMTGATSGAPSSDAARAAAEHRILLGYNNKTLDQVLDQMQSEMRGRSDAYASVLKEISGGAYSGPSVPFDDARGGAPAPANIIRYDAKGNRIK